MTRFPGLFSSSFLFLAACGGLFARPLAAEPAGDPPQPTPITALLGATIIDGTGRPPLENATLLLRGDRIVAMGSGATVPAGA